ncbi:NADH:ubiquinone oxidoreductase subunit NDUFA12 [Bartonella sp. DGB1]|uniref:NADH:ubiquinone oxidoreductase subunit NDUFA12 n=1 Tax=Bartonella sp. DGB1 TaxID=3239807 RepID=UPI0035269515
MNWLKKIFTWWNGSTLGTDFFTWRKGKFVGVDEFGNKYYQGSKNIDGRPKRWVIYCCLSEASLVPPGWHGWLHYRVDIAPSEEVYQPYDWQKPHVPNLTSTLLAYRPNGVTGKAVSEDKSYQPWIPPADKSK